MIMELVVLDLLRRSANESDGKARLSKTQIQKRLIEEYKVIHPHPDEAEEIFSSSKIRTAIDRLMDHGYPGAPVVECAVTHRKDGSEYRTGFYVEKSFTDIELKFLVDSVMYSKAIDSKTAEDLTRRIKSLSGKRLDITTPYTSEAVFGRRDSVSNIDVLGNMDIILDAIFKNRYLKFTFHKYDVVQNKIVLCPNRKCCVIPLQVFLDGGQYYLLAEYALKQKVYTFRLDLMTDLVITEKKIESNRFEVDRVAKYRADYIQQNPFLMGGKPEQFKLRAERSALSILASTFGTDVAVMSGTVTDTTVDVVVVASAEGMKLWLLLNYDTVTLLDAPSGFCKDMEEIVQQLKEKYLK